MEKIKQALHIKKDRSADDGDLYEPGPNSPTVKSTHLKIPKEEISRPVSATGSHPVSAPHSPRASRDTPRNMSLRYDNPATGGPDPNRVDPNAGHFPGGQNDPAAAPLAGNPSDPTRGPNPLNPSNGNYDPALGGVRAADHHRDPNSMAGGERTLDPSVTGPAPTTAGPHKKDILNKLDPRVDSKIENAAVGSTGNAYGAPGTGYAGNDPKHAAQHDPNHPDHKHHYGRDAAGVGAGAAGLGAAYEAKKYLHNKHDSELSPEELQERRAFEHSKGHNGGHNHLGDLPSQSREHHDVNGDAHNGHHLGRDAAGVAGVGGAAYEANKHLGHHNGHGTDKSLPTPPGQEGNQGLVDRTRHNYEQNDPNHPTQSHSNRLAQDVIPGHHNNNNTTNDPNAQHGLQHPGRDAAAGAAALGGAGALAHHEHSKHEEQKQHNVNDPTGALSTNTQQQHTDPNHPPGTKDGHWSWRPGTGVPELAAIGRAEDNSAAMGQSGGNSYAPGNARNPGGAAAVGGHHIPGMHNHAQSGGVPGNGGVHNGVTGAGAPGQDQYGIPGQDSMSSQGNSGMPGQAVPMPQGHGGQAQAPMSNEGSLNKLDPGVGAGVGVGGHDAGVGAGVGGHDGAGGYAQAPGQGHIPQGQGQGAAQDYYNPQDQPGYGSGNMPPASAGVAGGAPAI